MGPGRADLALPVNWGLQRLPEHMGPGRTGLPLPVNWGLQEAAKFCLVSVNTEKAFKVPRHCYCWNGWNVNMTCFWPNLYVLFEFYNKYQNYSAIFFLFSFFSVICSLRTSTNDSYLTQLIRERTGIKHRYCGWKTFFILFKLKNFTTRPRKGERQLTNWMLSVFFFKLFLCYNIFKSRKMKNIIK